MKRFFPLALFCGVLASAAFCAVATFSDAARDFQQARELFDQQQWDQAKAAAERALMADPKMGDAEILLGLVATVRSRFEDAEQHFIRGAALEPDNYQAHAYLGSTYVQEKKFPEANRAFRKVLELKPGNAAANYNLGLIALEEGSPAEALRRFEIVLGSSPSDVPALTGVLTSQLALRREADAHRTAAQLQKILEDRDPRLLQAAALLAEHGETAAAIPLMERVRRASPQVWNINYNLAVAYFQTDQYERAADVLRPFTGAGGRAEASNLLGAIEEKRGRTLEAEHAFEAAAAREPSNESYRFDYGNSLLQHGNIGPALQVFSTAVSDFPGSWKIKIGLGSAYYLASEYENAARVLLEAVKLRPDSAAGWYLLGEAYDSAPALQREIGAAFASYVETAPRDPGAYYHYGVILFQRAQADGRTDYQKATQNLNQALRLNPNLAEAHFELGLIALAQGKTRQSIAELQKAVSLEPGFGTAHYRLGLAYKKIGNETAAREELSRFKALREDEHQRGRVLQSLATMGTTAKGSGERP